MDLIVNAIYKRDGLSVISKAYRIFNDLLTTKREYSESMKGFELRFAAGVAKFNGISESTKLSECLTSLMLISNAEVTDSESVSVLASAASSSDFEDSATTSNEEFLTSISYSSVASVVKQCEGRKGRELQGNLVTPGGGYQNYNRSGNFSRRMTKKQYEAKTMKSPCAICGKYGHWKREHLPDGSLPAHVKAVEKPSKDNPQPHYSDDKTNEYGGSSKSNKTVSFSSAIVTIEDNTDVQCTCNDKDKYGQECQICEDWSLPDPKVSVNLGNVDKNIISSSPAVLISNMAIFRNDSNKPCGPLLDDGAPYSALGEVELRILLDELGLTFPRQIDPIPRSLQGFSYFQYGTGSHASQSRKILGSVVLTAYSDSNRPIDITHIVLRGSSQWIVGRNVTRKADIQHINGNALVFCVGELDERDSIKLFNDKFLSYIPMDRFSQTKNFSSISALSARPVPKRTWNEIKHIIEKVHKHVCGHASFSDFKMLLERNNIWNAAVEEYICQLINNCRSCKKSALPSPSRKVSISMMSKEFTEIVCVDHFYLNDICLIHFMELTSRFSSASVVHSKDMESVIKAFEENWVNHFWYPENIKGDKAFEEGAFSNYIKERDISFQLVPTGRHSRNPIESKHGSIRNIFVRLIDAYMQPEIAAVKAVGISNELYGNTVMSAYELAKGYSKPICGKPVTIPDEVINAYEAIQARRKLSRILNTKSTSEPSVNIGDMVEIYQHGKNGKRGQWSEAKKVIKVDNINRTITVPGKNGKTVCAAFEDVRATIGNDNFTMEVSSAIDQLDDAIEDILNPLQENKGVEDRCLVNSNNNDDQLSTSNVEDIDLTIRDNVNEPLMGENVAIFWPLDNTYYPGTVTAIEDGISTILYEDGEIEVLNMSDETWKYQEDKDTVASASSSTLELQSNEQEILSQLSKFFGNKPFLRFQCQGFEQFPLINAYRKEEVQFLNIVKPVLIESVPRNANIIDSHTLYKVKHNDDDTLALKARIAPHVNEDRDKEELTTDCATCSPSGIRVVKSMASLKGWKLKRGDAKGAFLKTGDAERDVWMIPPRESDMRKTHRWLLIVAAYGLVNSGAKWQHQSDEVLQRLKLVQSRFIPQLFYMYVDGELVMVLAKIVDDIILTGKDDITEKFLSEFNEIFELGSVVSGPGNLRFFGININQNDDYSIEVNAEDKLLNVNEYKLSPRRKKQYDSYVNEIEKKIFMSTNSTLGWIGSAISPICSYYASYMQQKAPRIKVSHLVEQNNIIRKLKRYGKTVSYQRPPLNTKVELSVLAFSDASKVDENGQLGIICGLLVGDMSEGSVFHPITWLSHKSRRPIKSVPAAEILAASEAIDEAKAIAGVYSELFNMNIKVRLCVDSKDLFTSLSTQRLSVDRSIRGDVGVIRYEFQTGVVDRITWIPGKVNIADVLTKKDSALSETFILALASGYLPLEFKSQSESKYTEKNLG